MLKVSDKRLMHATEQNTFIQRWFDDGLTSTLNERCVFSDGWLDVGARVVAKLVIWLEGPNVTHSKI